MDLAEPLGWNKFAIYIQFSFIRCPSITFFIILQSNEIHYDFNCDDSYCIGIVLCASLNSIVS